MTQHDDAEIASPTRVGHIVEKAALQWPMWSKPAKAWHERDADGKWVVRWSGGGTQVDSRTAQEWILTEFLDLANGSPEDVARFVERWGFLDLCAHGLPTTHMPRRMWADLDALGGYPCEMGLRTSRRLRFEPIERWHHFARQALALHQAAQAILSRGRVSSEVWLTMRDLLPTSWVRGEDNAVLVLLGIGQDPAESQPAELVEPREGLDAGFVTEPPQVIEHRLMRMALQRWLDLGDVGIHVDWKDGDGSLTFGGKGMFGAIAMQLALTCSGEKSLWVCSICNKPYTPKRRPRSGERHYCGRESCRKAGNRRAQRKSRERKKSAADPSG